MPTYQNMTGKELRFADGRILKPADKVILTMQEAANIGNALILVQESQMLVEAPLSLAESIVE